MRVLFFCHFGPGNGSPSANNVIVLGVVVIRYPIPYIGQGSVVSQPIVMKLFIHILDNILHQATVADF